MLTFMTVIAAFLWILLQNHYAGDRGSVQEPLHPHISISMRETPFRRFLPPPVGEGGGGQYFVVIKFLYAFK